MAKITTSNIRTGILVFVTAVPLTTITIIVWWYWGVRGIADSPPPSHPFPPTPPPPPSHPPAPTLNMIKGIINNVSLRLKGRLYFQGGCDIQP